MSKSKYPKQPNKKPENPIGVAKQACCDCGLVHTMGITVDKLGRIKIDYERDNRATAQLRRGNFPYLKTPRQSDKWKMVKT